MKFRNRVHDDERGEDASRGRDPGDAPRERLRETGDELLSAADDAIRSALSGNSLEFLAASRQENGE